MIAWLRLDPTEWVPLVYGQPIKNLYQNVKLVRPTEGVVQEHTDWVLGKLVPSICLTVTTVPPNWRIPQEQVA
jgi:hypothetical protein